MEPKTDIYSTNYKRPIIARNYYWDIATLTHYDDISDEFVEFLNNNYVSTQNISWIISRDMLNFALVNPYNEQYPTVRILIRDKSSKIIASICAIYRPLNVDNVITKSLHISFLCIARNMRFKGIARTLINKLIHQCIEIYRDHESPPHFATYYSVENNDTCCSFNCYRRYLNIDRLQSIGVLPNKLRAIINESRKIDMDESFAEYRPAQESDIDKIISLAPQQGISEYFCDSYIKSLLNFADITCHINTKRDIFVALYEIDKNIKRAGIESPHKIKSANVMFILCRDKKDYKTALKYAIFMARVKKFDYIDCMAHGKITAAQLENNRFIKSSTSTNLHFFNSTITKKKARDIHFPVYI